MPNGWSGTVRPQKTGWTFTPANQSYANVTANQSRNYTANPPANPVISGYVRQADNAAVSSVIMNGLPGNPSTNNEGFYSAQATYGWSGTVTPQKIGWTFTPANQSYANVTANQSRNYTASPPANPVISGYVRQADNSAVSNVIMNGLPGNPSTDSNGFYSAQVTYGWSGTVTPQKTGWTFTPASQSYTNVTANQSQNYTANPANLVISGYVRQADNSAVSNVMMNGLPGNPSTNSEGFYSAQVTYDWSGTVTPQKTGWTFTPASQSYANMTANQSQNYTASPANLVISGYVRRVDNTGVSGVIMTGLPGNPSTNGSGFTAPR